MSSSIKNIVTIGDGIAAWCLHEELLKLPNVKITNISSSDLFKPCSLNTTSLNCLRGTRRGLTELGDKVIDSYEVFEEFFNTHKPAGVFKGIEYQLWREDQHDKWMRRYPEFFKTEDNTFLQDKLISKFNYQQNEAYFIDPKTLKDWYRKRHSKVECLNGFVTSINYVEGGGYTVESNLNFNDVFDKVILCTNHATHLLARGLSEEFDYYLTHSKPVAGTYLEMPLPEGQYTDNLNIAIGAHHFIVRADSKRLQIGSTSDNKMDIDLPNNKDILNLYNSLQKCFTFELPPFEDFKKHTGIRHKGFERKPYWGRVTPNEEIYSVCGLYKNAFSFAYLAAKELSRTQQGLDCVE
jgi:hypothetical protein